MEGIPNLIVKDPRGLRPSGVASQKDIRDQQPGVFYMWYHIHFKKYGEDKYLCNTAICTHILLTMNLFCYFDPFCITGPRGRTASTLQADNVVSM